MQSDLNNRIDRYWNRELHPAAARAMAHEALDDSDLFDELSAVALVRAALDSSTTTDRGLAQAALDDDDLFDTLVARGAMEASVRFPPRRNRWPIAAAAAAIAAAAGLLTFFVLRPSSHTIQQPAQQARVIPNVLLSRDLKPTHSPDAPLFRGGGAVSRAPKSEGAIISLEGGIATVNVGSIDGLTKGTVLPITGGHMVITTVFRDHARGQIVDGRAVPKDPVRVPNGAHIAAILQQVDAIAAGGNVNAARDVARQALAAGTSGETRPLLERLAALDYQAGAPDAARERYEVAVNNFDQPPAASAVERATTLANYGALALLNGDQSRAQDLLNKALPLATDPMLRSQIVYNLGLAKRQ
jgi:hypothetical protein